MAASDRAADRNGRWKRRLEAPRLSTWRHCIMSLSKMTLSIMTLTMMTLSTMTHSTMTLSMMTLSIMTLAITIKKANSILTALRLAPLSSKVVVSVAFSIFFVIILNVIAPASITAVVHGTRRLAGYEASNPSKIEDEAAPGLTSDQGRWMDATPTQWPAWKAPTFTTVPYLSVSSHSYSDSLRKRGLKFCPDMGKERGARRSINGKTGAFAKTL